jgi:DNA-binding NarL/FixJ family response regulator
VVDCLPASWQWPAYCAARIVYGESSYLTTPFQEGPWRLTADFVVAGAAAGRVEVFYTANAPVAPGTDAFLNEERALLNVVAERVSSALSHMRIDAELHDAHEVLQRQNQALQETNIALKTVLSRMEDEKREIRASIAGSIEKIVMPIVLELELATAGRQRSYVSLLRECLKEVAGPLHAEPTPWHVELSPTEVAIGTMIRNGLSTKEIADLRCISAGTVRRHRENIRKKLGLQNRRANLRTYLTTQR